MIASTWLYVLLAAVGRGSPAPAFALNGEGFGEAATGRAVSSPTVIAFLDFADDEKAAARNASSTRAQVDAVLSLWTSARAEGLRVVLIDAGATVRGRLTSVDEIQHRVTAWGIDAFPVVRDDPGSGLARRYGVTRTPAVFLLDGAGIVRGRWDDVVPVATLASELEMLR